MRFLACALALSLGVAYADVPANLLNQTIDGGTIHSGTYFGYTTFINTAGGGITLPKGENIHGLRGDDGGSIYIKAPDQVVNLNGNIDVRGTNIFANGGNVQVDAAYLFQNGNIYATGFKGGTVTMNVGGVTMATGSLIDTHATSVGGQQPGGAVSINSTGQVDIQKGAKIDVSGASFWVNNTTAQVLPGNYSNILISGPVVNMDGVLQASQMVLTYPSARFNDIGGGIQLVASNGDVHIGPNAILQADSVQGINNARTIVITASNDIKQEGVILANGSSGNSAVVHDLKKGYIFGPVNGQDGGKVSLTAGHDIIQSGRISADGGNAGTGYWGGNGGSIAFSAPDVLINNSVIRAMGGNAKPTDIPGPYNVLKNLNGGNGGNITFTGANASGTGTVVTLGGIGQNFGTLGTITAPDPAASSNTLIGVWKKLP